MIHPMIDQINIPRVSLPLLCKEGRGEVDVIAPLRLIILSTPQGTSDFL